MSAEWHSNCKARLSHQQEETKYVYDGDQVIAEFEGQRLVRKSIYGSSIDEPICMIDLTNSILNKCYEYDAFGEPEGKRDVNNACLITG